MTDACPPQIDFAAISQPTEKHDLLKPFAGTFKAEVTVHFGPDSSHSATGIMVNEFDLDGRYLKQTYTGDPSDGPFPKFQGRGYWGYNTIQKQFEGFWIDSASTAMATQTGQTQDNGKTWTMTGDQPDPCGTGTIPKRSVITLIDNDNHTLESFVTMPDGNESKTMSVTYTRA